MSPVLIDCVIYKGRLQPDYYLYVQRADNLSRVPGSLLAIMGELQHVMDLRLDEQRELAQAKARDVMRQLRENGYFLQMPPAKDGLDPQ